MTVCVFTGLEATKHTEQWAFERGLLWPEVDDITQIIENDNVIDGNDDYWSLMHEGKRILIRRKETD